MVVLVGCSGPGAGSDSSGADGGVGVAAPEAPGDPGSTPSDPDRQVVTTATASVEVEDPADVPPPGVGVVGAHRRATSRSRCAAAAVISSATRASCTSFQMYPSRLK